MKEYYLFLDESKPNSNFQNFTLGGIAIEKSAYEKIVKPQVLEIKKECFGDTSVILHESEIRSKIGAFSSVTSDVQKLFFEKLNALLQNVDEISVLAVSVNTFDLDKLYKADDRNDIYYIALQLLMENFTQFLSANDGIGLQIADFIPNPLARKALGKKQKPFSIINSITSKLYDGTVGMSERFGFKIIR